MHLPSRFMSKGTIFDQFSLSDCSESFWMGACVSNAIFHWSKTEKPFLIFFFNSPLLRRLKKECGEQKRDKVEFLDLIKQLAFLFLFQYGCTVSLLLLCPNKKLNRVFITNHFVTLWRVPHRHTHALSHGFRGTTKVDFISSGRRSSKKGWAYSCKSPKTICYEFMAHFNIPFSGQFTTLLLH